MSLIHLLIILVIIGVIMWAVNTQIPLTPGWRKLINAVVMIVVILWLLTVFGLLGPLDTIRVGSR